MTLVINPVVKLYVPLNIVSPLYFIITLLSISVKIVELVPSFIAVVVFHTYSNRNYKVSIELFMFPPLTTTTLPPTDIVFGFCLFVCLLSSWELEYL